MKKKRFQLILGTLILCVAATIFCLFWHGISEQENISAYDTGTVIFLAAASLGGTTLMMSAMGVCVFCVGHIVLLPCRWLGKYLDSKASA